MFRNFDLDYRFNLVTLPNTLRKSRGFRRLSASESGTDLASLPQPCFYVDYGHKYMSRVPFFTRCHVVGDLSASDKFL